MGETDEGGGTQWKGWSDYEAVAAQLHEDITSAVKAYSHIDSMQSQNVGITPRTAVRARGEILGITKRLFYEVKMNRNVDGFDDIYERWSGNEVGEDGGVVETEEDGYADKLESLDLTAENPEWLSQLVDDIIEAGWELGYIKAGTEKPAKPDADEEQVKEMFE